MRMNKKAQIKLIIIGIILLIVIVGFIVAYTNSSGREYDTPIGYKIYDDTVEIWNTKDSYFFLKESGIQLTNVPDSYWSKNIFCIGYYNNDEWNKIYCADELTNFEKTIDSDNETYVNITMWKNIEYGNYDLRLRINYYLGLNDKNLSVTIYGKNIGIDIPFDLGFAWKIKDIDIPDSNGKTQPYGDSIEINRTRYELRDTFDLLFKNMSYTYTNLTRNETTGELIDNGNITEYDSNFRLQDWTKFLRVDWDKDLPYTVKMYGDGNQSNFYVALLINAGHFNPNQEKSTTFNWVDAEGDYIDSWDSDLASGPWGFAVDDNYFWAIGADKSVNQFLLNTTPTGFSFTATDVGTPEGLDSNGTHLWIGDSTGKEVHLYLHNGTRVNNWDTSGETCALTQGIDTDGTNIWISDTVDVCKYSMTGTHISDWTFDDAESHFKFTTDGTYLWAARSAQDVMKKYWINGTATGDSFATTADSAKVRGMTQNGTYIWLSNYDDHLVYRYEGPGVPIDSTNPYSKFGKNPIDTYNSTNTSQTFDFKCGDDIDTSWMRLYGNWSDGTSEGWHANYTDTSYTNGTYLNISSFSIGEGKWIWGLWCNDTSGYINWSSNRTFTIDATTPFITYGLNTETNATNVSRSWTFINASYKEINPNTLTFNLYNDSTWNQTYYRTSNNVTNNTINFTGLADGVYRYNVTLNDTASNSNTTIERYIQVDTTSPTITILSPSDGHEDTDGIIDFYYNVSDASSVKNCSLYLDNLNESTDTSITKNAQQTFKVLQPPEKDNLQWFISCNDVLSNNGNSTARGIDTKLGGSTVFPGGGSFVIPEPEINVTEENITEEIICGTNVSVPFKKAVSLFFQIPLKKCKLNFLKNFFSINENYEISGIRWFTIILLGSFALVFFFTKDILKTDSKIKKIIRDIQKDLNKQKT